MPPGKGRHVLSTAGDILRATAELLWPPTCACCGTNEPTREGLCEACGREMLSLASLAYCRRCGTTAGPYLSPDGDGCAGCPPVAFRFGQVCRIGPYTGCLRSAVHRLKYSRRPVSARRLAGLLADAVAARGEGPAPDVVVPVPMHWVRRMARGWNHARALGAGMARRLGVPVEPALRRVRNTPPQVHVPASQRAANVRGAFSAGRTSDVGGATVLLVDDVMTTGATCNEAARTLLAAGAERVRVAVLARAEPPTAYSRRLAELGGP